MGYYSNINGDLNIKPPLTNQELRNDKIALYIDPKDDKLIKIEVEEETRHTHEGKLIVCSGVAIVPNSDERRKHYDLEDQFEELIEAIQALPNKHEVIGWMVRDGERQGDVQRYKVSNGQLVTELAKLVWPDGSDARQ